MEETYVITEDQNKIIQEFLSRVPLKWSEVSAFNQIVYILSNPVKKEKKS